jgi:leucyl-tRNA synthetase
MNADWPQKSADYNESLLSAAEYIRALGSKIRSAEDAAAKKKKGKKATDVVAPEFADKTIRLYVATTFPDWQEDAINVLKKTYDATTGTFAGDRDLLISTGLVKNKSVMPFVAMIKKEVEKSGPSSMDRKLAFSELDALNINIDYLRRDLAMLKINKVEIVEKQAAAEDPDLKKAELALPGQPTYRIL